jgi:hypothetical protein
MLEEKYMSDIPLYLYNKIIELNGSKIYIITALILLGKLTKKLNYKEKS